MLPAAMALNPSCSKNAPRLRSPAMPSTCRSNGRLGASASSSQPSQTPSTPEVGGRPPPPPPPPPYLLLLLLCGRSIAGAVAAAGFDTALQLPDCVAAGMGIDIALHQRCSAGISAAEWRMIGNTHSTRGRVDAGQLTAPPERHPQGSPCVSGSGVRLPSGMSAPQIGQSRKR